MGQVIGIDLGTTYSAVALPEQRAGERFLPGSRCPGCSIILDPFKRRITPSVVAEDEKGNIVVGHTAKNRAGMSPEPIMFAKRSMGEDVVFPLAKQDALRPEEVSAHILRYLKALAEAALGEPVDEAVITVPAYFSLRAKQMTEKAGELAGLRVAQIAPEPVAAALMYCAADPRENLRIMTYDLGGGTFDVAILERRDGVISTDSILAFDGDRFLGGYDFDKKLAFWIMDRLVERGYDLELDLKNPADKITFAKLMIYAERVKIKLSESGQDVLDDRSTGITDHSGNPVTIDELGITREQFEAMIAKDIEDTIALCERARTERAPKKIARDQFDEILMVGGSSRIPYVARRLEAEYGKKPRLVDPDLCVALGAALLAATKPRSVGRRLKLNPVPPQTDLPTLTVTGQLVPDQELTAVDGCTVELRASDGSYGERRSSGADGKFAFDGIRLTLDERTDFLLKATSPAGAEVAAHAFSVTQTHAVAGGGPAQPVTNLLAKPIGILTVDGLHIVAPVRTPLPYECVIPAQTADASGQIRVRIVEDPNPLGQILMPDIPKTLPVGSAVQITLMIQENYQIRGRAFVPALAREATVTIDIPVPPQKTLAELREDYGDLVVKAKEALASAGRGAMFADAKAKRLKDRMGDAEELLQGRAPELAKIQDCLDEIESLVRDIAAGWRPQPPRAIFEAQASQADDLLVQAIKKNPKVEQDGYDEQLKAIRAEAEKAYGAQNPAAWKESFEKLVKLCDQLERLARPDVLPPAPPTPAELLMQCSRELGQAEKWARANGLYAKFRADFEALAQDLKKIDPKGPNAMTEIVDWYNTKFSDLRQRLQAPKEEGDVRV